MQGGHQQQLHNSRPPPTMRHRGPPQMAPMPPPGSMRLPYVCGPPPLRGAVPRDQPPHLRHPSFSISQEHRGPQPPPTSYGPPPPARHAAAHLNSYR